MRQSFRLVNVFDHSLCKLLCFNPYLFSLAASFLCVVLDAIVLPAKYPKGFKSLLNGNVRLVSLPENCGSLNTILCSILLSYHHHILIIVVVVV